MKQFAMLTMLLVLLSGCTAERYKAISPNQDVIVTTNIKEGSVSFLNENNSSLIATWQLKKAIMGSLLLPDNDTLLVYGRKLENVYLYSLKKGKEVGAWNTGEGIANAILSRDKTSVIFANQNNNEVYIYSIKGKKQKNIPVGKGPLTMVEQKGIVYVVNFNDTSISVIDLRTQQLTHTMAVPASSTGAIINKKKNELLIGGHGSGEQVNSKVFVYSLAAQKEEKTIEAPYMPVNFTTDGNSIYVLSHGSNMLRKLDADTYKEEGAVEVASNPFSVLASGGQIYVGSYDSDEVYIVDAENMKVTNKVSVGKGPFHMIERKGEKE